MSLVTPLVVFLLDEQRYAVPLGSVERIVEVVAIAPLPKAPTLVRGVINVAGEVVPVVDLRSRLRLPAREVALSDQLLLARLGERSAALLVDAVEGVLEAPTDAIMGAQQVLPGLPDTASVLKLPDGLIVIHNLDRFLSLDEAQALDAALGGG